ncbi:uncharacterized protein N0V89_011368 [Didymosphaeria variabile]|uniref:Heterokaryon incompatibility domain-containing protein n=1 Tax=Didymosphaeria variabile TaxID=1932322 RepID=A0A9W8X9V5_9PLEO|nr:uncharacterized protein N0V89_011368 [Didymosphaeria variabile]KAJ4345239.1 hypothetical protein N0V89_011368 [Didymosphaeria variabile]
MTTANYQYKPLRPNEIRVLQLCKAEHGEATFRLSHEILDETLDYEAVSYTWGSRIRENAIQHADTGGRAFVTANCEQVLRSLLSTGNDRIWIDGLCINQGDKHERSEQVRLMGKIYRIAKRTIAYIGEHDDHSRAVMAATAGSQTCFRASQTIILQAYLGDSGSAAFNKPCYQIGHEELNFDILGMWNSKLAVSRGYWHHEQGVVTLKTEFSRGSNTGSYQEWDQSILHPSRRDFLQKSVLWKTPASALNLITSTSLLNPGYLFDVLCATAHYECTDPRDKFFALVSLFANGLPEALKPDYLCSVDELYTNISRFLLSYGVARVLSAATCDDTGKIPSWAIDWRRKFHQDALGRTDGVFAACSSAGFASFRQTNIRIISHHVIKVRGLRLTQVSTCSPNAGQAAAHADLTDLRKLNDYHRNEWLYIGYALSGARPLDQYLELVSADGITGLVPKETQQGDWICILLGFTVPFVLRPCKAEQWTLLGECYVQDYMQGEAVKVFKRHHVHDPEPTDPLEDFVII